jgi:hypothetical protein
MRKKCRAGQRQAAHGGLVSGGDRDWARRAGAGEGPVAGWLADWFRPATRARRRCNRGVREVNR